MPEIKGLKENLLSRRLESTLLIALVLLFIASGFIISAGAHPLIIVQPVLFTAIFLVALTYFGLDRKTAGFLFLIFLLGYAIRAQNIQPGYDYFFAFDSYYHARMTGYVIKDGAPPAVDNLGYYELPEEQRRVGFDGQFFWYFSALFFKLFTLGAAYNKHLLIEFVKVFPPFLGAFISLLMFFLAKELFGKKAGFVTAFVAATVPSYVYRTMAGFFEDDALGFLGFVLGFIFFFRAVKEHTITRRSLINAVLAGFFFAFMGWSWSFYPIIPILLFLLFPFAFLLSVDRKFSSKEKISIVAFLAHYIVPIIIFALLLAPFRSFNWLSQSLSYIASVLPIGLSVTDPGFILGILFLLFAFAFLAFLFVRVFEEIAASGILRAAVSVLIFIAFVFVVIVLLDPGGIFSSRFVEHDVFMSTVGEESPGKDTFGYKYNAYIFFPWLALIFIPAWIFFKKDDFLSPFAFWWIATALVMAWYKLKFTYVFGLPIALAAGFVAASIFYALRKNRELELRIAAGLLVFMLVCGVGAASYFVLQRPPSLETQKEWKNTLHWIRDNTPKDAKMFNWWSYGHWLTFIAERNVFADNRNINWQISDGEFARFLISEDINEALSIIKKYKPDYIVLSSDMFSGFNSMFIYAYNIHRNKLLTTPGIKEKIFSSYATYSRCNATKQGTYSCSGLAREISEEEMASLPAVWQEVPNQLKQNQLPEWIYRDENNLAIAILGPTVNSSMLAKLWFKASELQEYFEEVHSEFGSTAVKVFRVKKKAFE